MPQTAPAPASRAEADGSRTPVGPTAVRPPAVRPPAAAMGRSAPVRLRVPAIGVDSALMGLGLRADGALEVPPSGFPAGWYTGGPTPGQVGPAVLAGHVDWDGERGVFARLSEVRPGDEVSVTRQDGSVAGFRVREVRSAAKDEFPTDAVYGNLDHAGLRLITCGGAFDRSTRHYVDNLVVFADLVVA